MVSLHRYIIHPDRCKRCGRCVNACAQGAIFIPRGAQVTTTYGEVGIDQTLCDGCGKCILACKIRAISKVFKPHF